MVDSLVNEGWIVDGGGVVDGGWMVVEVGGWMLDD